MFDIKEIQNQFDEVLKYSQDLQDVKTDSIFETWLKNKQRFIDMFNGELIYEFPEKICFDLSENAKVSRVTDLCDYIDLSLDSKELADFIFDVRDDFFSNILSAPYKMKNGNVISANSKIIKAFKFFEKRKDVLTEAQNMASMLIQEDKVIGKLCISVHPLDYLSSSENTYNWRSCHSLDGEYRVGNVSYIMDNSTVICYLKGDSNVVLPNFPDSVPWNNKKWRVLLHTNETQDLIFIGRQYPFTSSTALNKVKELIFPLFSKDIYTEWNNDVTDDEQIFINNDAVKLKDTVCDCDGSNHFNDILFSSCYIPYYSYKPNLPKYEKITVGNKLKCIKCGKHYNNSPDTFLCLNCLLEKEDTTRETFETIRCEDCLELVDPDSIILRGEDNAPICSSCATNYYYCFKCHQLHKNKDIYYNVFNNKYKCKNCKNNNIIENFFYCYKGE